MSQAQAPFAAAYDHLCHLQSLFKAQAHALRIAYANLSYHLDPIMLAFREFSARAENQLDNQEKLLAGYHVDMAMLPKVVVHEAVFRRREKDSVDKRKALVDWIHTKKMEEVRNHCQVAHCELLAPSLLTLSGLRQPVQHRPQRDGRVGHPVGCGSATG